MEKVDTKKRTTKRKTNKEFLQEARMVHGDKYDYSKVEYVNQETKVCIICPIHGDFWQKPRVHLMGRGCQECGKEICRKPKQNTKKRRKRTEWNTDTFIEECKKLYGEERYTYENTKYNGVRNKVHVNCPKHGDFLTTPNKFLNGRCGCQKCWIEKKHNLYASNTEEFIEKAKKENGTKMYDYSKVEYKNNSTKVCVICPEHGEFWVTPANHLKHRGCPMCKAEKLSYEQKLFYILSDIVDTSEIIRQYKDYEMFGRQSIDFYIPKYKIAIEHQGSQHFGGHFFDDSEERYKRIQQLDRRKYEICKEHGIKLFYFSYEERYVPEVYLDTVYTDITEFKNDIIKYINKINKKQNNEQ